MTARMSLAAWRERLKAHRPSDLAFDGETRPPGPLADDVDVDAANIEEAARRGARRDGLWVIWATENGPENGTIGRVRQLRRVEVTVLYRVAPSRGGVPFEDQDAIDRLRARVDAALLGWTPPGADTAIDFARGSALEPGEDGAAWWADTYRTRRLIEGEAA